MKTKLFYSLILVFGLAFTGSAFNSVNGQTTQEEMKKDTVKYTCPMHREVIAYKPGKCPTCNMDLVDKKELKKKDKEHKKDSTMKKESDKMKKM
jgi:hypothetical protein